jgi:hypothetical protein
MVENEFQNESNSNLNLSLCKMNQSHVKLIRILKSSESDVDKIKAACELIPKVVVDNELLEAVLETRNEIIIRLLFEYASVSLITPEQLSFFVPRKPNASERRIARTLASILFEHKYEFGQDEMSQQYFDLIMQNDMMQGH